VKLLRAWGRWTAAPHERAKRIVLSVAALAVLASWIGVVAGRFSDLPTHREFGRRFVSGEALYADGTHAPYPPSWAVACVPVSFLPLPVARTLCFPATLAALALLLVVLHRLTRISLPLSRRALFWTLALALGLSLRFIDREMTECGPNMTLLALSWLGVYFWVRRREWAGGTCLGLAMALKCTPALFLAYFAWKREWKMAAVTAAATLLFTLAPVLRLGPATYARDMQVWSARLLPGITRAESSHGIMHGGLLQNVALQPALERFLMRTRPGQSLHLEHPLYVQFLNLSPALGGLLAKAGLLALLAAVAWRFRGRVERRDSLRILWECAGVSLLMLLLSPITWQQHCVGVIPAFYMLARTLTFWAQRNERGEAEPVVDAAPDGRRLMTPRLAGWVLAAAGIWFFWILVLNYQVVGRGGTMLLHGYHVITWNLVMLLAMVLACHRQVAPLKARVAQGGRAGRIWAQYGST